MKFLGSPKLHQFAMFAEGAGGGSWPKAAVIGIHPGWQLSGDKLPTPPKHQQRDRRPGDCGQNDPSLASALGAISDSSAHFIAAAAGATDRNLPSRHFPCPAYGDPYLFVDRDVRGFARGTRS